MLRISAFALSLFLPQLSYAPLLRSLYLCFSVEIYLRGLQDAEKMVQEAMAIDNKDCFPMAEFVSVCDKKKEPGRCLQAFDDFLGRVSFGKGREHQAMFNNIFRLCSRFNKKEEAEKYFRKFSHVLDDRNIDLYHQLFP